MPIQCVEGQTPTPAKLAASHAAADELRHQLFDFRSRAATGTTNFFLQSSSNLQVFAESENGRDRLKSAAPTTSVRQRCAGQCLSPCQPFRLV
jgi:hypothetical protein